LVELLGQPACGILSRIVARRLLFFPDYQADPIWDADSGGMLSLDDLPVRAKVRTDVRDWSRRWEGMALDDQAAEEFAAGMSQRRAEPVAEERRASLERDGRAVWRRLQAELGDEWLVGWACFGDDSSWVEWSPGAPREPR
jgi:hypothetical protein